jgi:glutamine cyclotransferase
MFFQGQGWGLTFDGTHLVRSDGSATLYLHDTETFAEVGQIEVTDGGQTVKGLNELEMVEGKLFANIWMTDRIAIIDPANGRVTGWLDLSVLPHPKNWKQNNAFLNGIAYDQQKKRLFVTGKLWPQLFEIESP